MGIVSGACVPEKKWEGSKARKTDERKKQALLQRIINTAE